MERIVVGVDRSKTAGRAVPARGAELREVLSDIRVRADEAGPPRR